MTQSTAVYLYLGRKLDLMGKTEEDLVAVEQTIAQVFHCPPLPPVRLLGLI